jgi:hypothetical protein
MITMRASVLGAVLLIGLVVGPASADWLNARHPVRPWCEVSSADDFWRCDFTTFEQCQKFAWGDGVCQHNPLFQPAMLDPRRRSRTKARQ